MLSIEHGSALGAHNLHHQHVNIYIYLEHSTGGHTGIYTMVNKGYNMVDSAWTVAGMCGHEGMSSLSKLGSLCYKGLFCGMAREVRR